MYVFQKYTNQTLKKNKIRTLVTLLGITVSMILFTMVTEGVCTGFGFLQKITSLEDGSYHGQQKVSNMDRDNIHFLDQENEIADYTYWENVGWTDFTVIDPYAHKDSIQITAIQDNITDYLTIELLEGRFPENDRELLIPKGLIKNGFPHQVGDQVSLDLTSKNIKNQSGVSTTYKIVGVYKQLDSELESSKVSFYTAFTKGKGNGDFTFFYHVKHPWLFALRGGFKNNTGYWRVHEKLMRYYGYSENKTQFASFFGIILIFLLLVLLASVFLIYHSFSSSVAERTKQFGILKSIGATKRQLKQTIIYEGLSLGIVGISLGLLLGTAFMKIVLFLLKDRIKQLLGSGIKLEISVTLQALLVAVGISLATILVSCYIPAVRAMNLNPIEAIRQKTDVVLSYKEIKPGKLSKKIFAFEADLARKDYARNKKQHRGPVLAVFAGVVIFICSMVLQSYLEKLVKVAVSTEETADILYKTKNRVDDGLETLDRLKQAEGVTDACAYSLGKMTFELSAENITDKYDYYVAQTEIWASSVSLSAEVVFLDDESYKKLVEKNNLDKSYYQRDENYVGLMYNYLTIHSDNSSLSRRMTIKCVTSRSFPLQLKYDTYQSDRDRYGHLNVVAEIKKLPLSFQSKDVAVFYPCSAMDEILVSKQIKKQYPKKTVFAFLSEDHNKTYQAMQTILASDPSLKESLLDNATKKENAVAAEIVVKTLSRGFAVLMAFIILVNVAYSIAVSIKLRRKTYAMLQSVGFSNRSIRKMILYESLVYSNVGFKWGFPVACILSYVIYRLSNYMENFRFYIPVTGILIAVFGILFVSLLTAFLSGRQIRSDSLPDLLKNENI